MSASASLLRQLQILVLACLVSACVTAPRPTEPDLAFFVLGDWGDQGSSAQRSVAEAMNRVATSRRVDFIATVGDNFYPHGVQSREDPLFEKAFATVYDLPALQHLPWYVTLGNHDYHGNYRAQIEYGRVDPRWHLPSNYYTRTVTLGGKDSALLVFADSNPHLRSYRERPEKYRGIADLDPSRQTAWLEQTLCGSSARWRFVFAHHPIRSNGHHGDAPELAERWLPILSRCAADIYFSGHEHHLEFRELNPDLVQVISGAGAKLRPVTRHKSTAFSQATLGFVLVSTTRRSTVVEYFSHDGSILYASTLRR